jgi:hypothetical protein
MSSPTYHVECVCALQHAMQRDAASPGWVKTEWKLSDLHTTSSPITFQLPLKLPFQKPYYVKSKVDSDYAFKVSRR